MANPLTLCPVPSFSQHNLILVVSGHCLHVSVTKFQDKFASLRQGNSPYSWNKFQICCTDVCLIRFLLNFPVFFVFLCISRDFADLLECCGSSTAWNIRSPDIHIHVHVPYKCTVVQLHEGCHLSCIWKECWWILFRQGQWERVCTNKLE